MSALELKRMVLLSSMALSACQAFAPSVPAGSELLLNQPLTIFPNRASTYIQNGSVNPDGYSEYEPYCRFALRNVSDQARRIAPGTFQVRKVQNQDYYAGRGRFPLLVQLGSSDSPSRRFYSTALYLHSKEQPEVYSLTCGEWLYPYEGRHLTLSGMQAVLGNVFTLRSATDQGSR